MRLRKQAVGLDRVPHKLWRFYAWDSVAGRIAAGVKQEGMDAREGRRRESAVWTRMG
jgi:hypothetical protein